MFCIVIWFICLISQSATQKASDFCNIDEINSKTFAKHVVPDLDDSKSKGEAGKICIIGGSKEYTGAPYFAAISALKAGADLVYVITTESAAPVIKSYSPDLIVYPYLHNKFLFQINSLIPRMDVIVIGPGLGRDFDTMSLVYDIIKRCRDWMKPLVIDADGLYALSRNWSILEEYPTPGAILTPNHLEAERLEKSIQKTTNNSQNWYNYWGDHVSVLVKGKIDKFYSRVNSFEWEIKGGGSGRRAAGQGDILAGSLGTFYNWAIKSNLCSNYHYIQLAQSLASGAAANLTRMSNYLAFLKSGRSMTASDMIEVIHDAFENLTRRPALP